MLLTILLSTAHQAATVYWSWHRNEPYSPCVKQVSPHGHEFQPCAVWPEPLGPQMEVPWLAQDLKFLPTGFRQHPLFLSPATDLPWGNGGQGGLPRCRPNDPGYMEAGNAACCKERHRRWTGHFWFQIMASLTPYVTLGNHCPILSLSFLTS